MLQPREKNALGDATSVSKCLKEGCKDGGARLSEWCLVAGHEAMDTNWHTPLKSDVLLLATSLLAPGNKSLR